MVKGSVSLPTELLHCYGIQRCFGCYCLFSFRTPVVVISSVVSCLGCFFFWLHQSHGGVDQGQHPSIYSEGFFNANGWKMGFPKTLTMSIL